MLGNRSGRSVPMFWSYSSSLIRQVIENVVSLNTGLVMALLFSGEGSGSTTMAANVELPREWSAEAVNIQN